MQIIKMWGLLIWQPGPYWDWSTNTSASEVTVISPPLVSWLLRTRRDPKGQRAGTTFYHMKGEDCKAQRRQMSGRTHSISKQLPELGTQYKSLVSIPGPFPPTRDGLLSPNMTKLECLNQMWSHAQMFWNKMYMNPTLGKKCHTGFPLGEVMSMRKPVILSEDRVLTRVPWEAPRPASRPTTWAHMSLTPLSHHTLCRLSSFSEYMDVPDREAWSLPNLNIYSSTTVTQKPGAKLITTWISPEKASVAQREIQRISVVLWWKERSSICAWDWAGW